jgi:hypothetical protein
LPKATTRFGSTKRKRLRRPIRSSTLALSVAGIASILLSIKLRPTKVIDDSLIISKPDRQRLGAELQLCFVTCEFSESVQDADSIPKQDATMIRDPPRHFLFTNLEDLDLEQGWTKIMQTEFPYKRLITQSRWGKFVGWKHKLLQHCQVIFYVDAYLLHPVNESAWQEMGRLIVESDVGLMQGRQIGNNRIPVKGPVVELKRNARIGKVSWEAANYTIEWLRSRPDFQFRNTPVYKNALFGYDPRNPTFRVMTDAFWEEYSKEAGSWRDQPYWAYFLTKYQMTPLQFPFDPPLGDQGSRGHNGHIYVVQNNNTRP